MWKEFSKTSQGSRFETLGSIVAWVAPTQVASVAVRVEGTLRGADSC